MGVSRHVGSTLLTQMTSNGRESGVGKGKGGGVCQFNKYILVFPCATEMVSFNAGEGGGQS